MRFLLFRFTLTTNTPMKQVLEFIIENLPLIVSAAVALAIRHNDLRRLGRAVKQAYSDRDLTETEVAELRALLATALRDNSDVEFMLSILRKFGLPLGQALRVVSTMKHPKDGSDS